MPEAFRGKLFAVEPLQGRVMLSDVSPDRSSVKTRDLDPVVASTDSWFRPVDIKPAPDGSIFVADFYEAKIAHLDHHAGRIDRDTGRIYRLAPANLKPQRPIDWNSKSSTQLVDALRDPNRWTRQTALRLLGDRRDANVIPALKKMLADEQTEVALDALWGLNLSGGFDESIAAACLDHRQPAVRAWAVRLLADDRRLGPLAKSVAERATTEPDVHVRVQWASSARRLPVSESLPIVAALLRRDEDADDIHIPLLLWWAIETHCDSHREQVLDLFRDSTLWQSKLSSSTILPRLIKRWAMAGTQKDLLACAELLRLAPNADYATCLLMSMEDGFRGRSVAALPNELLTAISERGGGSTMFGVRLGRADALAKAFTFIRDNKAKLPDRLDLIDVLGDVRTPRAVPVLLELLDDQTDAIRRAAIGSLTSYNDPAIGAAVLQRYPKWTGEVRSVAESLLAARKSWSLQWLESINTGVIPAKSIPRESARKLLLHRDPAIAEQVKKHWGDLARGATTAEMKSEVDRLATAIAIGSGDPYPGKIVYTARCANCHVLHNHGSSVGPDLTTFKRDDTAQLLLHIINPSAEIREGYENHVVITESGRTVNGVLAEKDARVVVLKTADGQKVATPRDDIAEMVVSGTSLMPEKLFDGLADQDIRDLFAYLRTAQPLNERRKQ